MNGRMAEAEDGRAGRGLRGSDPQVGRARRRLRRLRRRRRLLGGRRRRTHEARWIGQGRAETGQSVRPKAASAAAAAAGKARRCFTLSPTDRRRFNVVGVRSHGPAAAGRVRGRNQLRPSLPPSLVRQAPSDDRFGCLFSRFVGEAGTQQAASEAKPVADARAGGKERERERAPLKKRVRVLDRPVRPYLSAAACAFPPPSLVHLCPSVRPTAGAARAITFSVNGRGGNQPAAAASQRTAEGRFSVPGWPPSFQSRSVSC